MRLSLRRAGRAWHAWGADIRVEGARAYRVGGIGLGGLVVLALRGRTAGEVVLEDAAEQALWLGLATLGDASVARGSLDLLPWSCWVAGSGRLFLRDRPLPGAGGSPLRVPMWGVDVARTGDALRVSLDDGRFALRVNGTEKLRAKVPGPEAGELVLAAELFGTQCLALRNPGAS